MSDDPATAAKLSDDDVRHVAKLARLAIPDDQIHRFAEQLSGILGYVEQIGEVDVEGVEPTAVAVPMTNVLRDDTIGPMLPVDAVLQNAPDRDPPFFKVPKVIGGDEDSAG
jgi:aspartyl-tRNA(Asn)/glutamyl-tRNA(Gln) amidotransferase subunit C